MTESVIEEDRCICLNFKLHHRRQIRLQLLFFYYHRALSFFLPFLCVFKSFTMQALSHPVSLSLCLIIFIFSSFLHSFFCLYVHSYLPFLCLFLTIFSLPLSYHDVCTVGSFITLSSCKYKGILILKHCQQIQEPPINTLQFLRFTSSCLSTPAFVHPWHSFLFKLVLSFLFA